MPPRPSDSLQPVRTEFALQHGIFHGRFASFGSVTLQQNMLTGRPQGWPCEICTSGRHVDLAVSDVLSKWNRVAAHPIRRCGAAGLTPPRHYGVGAGMPAVPNELPRTFVSYVYVASRSRSVPFPLFSASFRLGTAAIVRRSHRSGSPSTDRWCDIAVDRRCGVRTSLASVIGNPTSRTFEVDRLVRWPSATSLGSVASRTIRDADRNDTAAHSLTFAYSQLARARLSHLFRAGRVAGY